MTALDADLGVNAEVRYSLLFGGDGRFRLNQTSGALYTTASLDQAYIPEYILTVQAMDSAQQSRSVHIQGHLQCKLWLYTYTCTYCVTCTYSREGLCTKVFIQQGRSMYSCLYTGGQVCPYTRSPIE